MKGLSTIERFTITANRPNRHMATVLILIQKNKPKNTHQKQKQTYLLIVEQLSEMQNAIASASECNEPIEKMTCAALRNGRLKTSDY